MCAQIYIHGFGPLKNWLLLKLFEWIIGTATRIYPTKKADDHDDPTTDELVCCCVVALVPPIRWSRLVAFFWGGGDKGRRDFY